MDEIAVTEPPHDRSERWAVSTASMRAYDAGWTDFTIRFTVMGDGSTLATAKKVDN